MENQEDQKRNKHLPLAFLSHLCEDASIHIPWMNLRTKAPVPPAQSQETTENALQKMEKRHITCTNRHFLVLLAIAILQDRQKELARFPCVVTQCCHFFGYYNSSA
jgi:hypothetical protein